MVTLLAPIFDLPAPVQQLTNLADARIGAEILECSDEFFAEAKRMLQFEAPVFIEDKFDEHGKWMDGWETRRKRHTGYDWAIIKLAVAGQIQALDIDTTFFSGNYPASAAVQACYAPDGNLDQAEWISIIENNAWAQPASYCSDFSKADIYPCAFLNIYPDGGIARFKVYGQVKINLHHSDQMLDVFGTRTWWPCRCL